MALLSVLNHTFPKGNPLIPNLQMKSEAFLLLVKFSTVAAIPPSPPETNHPSCGPLSHTFIEEPKTCLFQGISLSFPAPPPSSTLTAKYPRYWRNHMCFSGKSLKKPPSAGQHLLMLKPGPVKLWDKDDKRMRTTRSSGACAVL